MFDKKKIYNLSVILSDSLNLNIRSEIARKKINGVLHNSSINTVMKDLAEYLKIISGKDKNKVVLLVVMALLRRNLDCAVDISVQIKKHNLTGCLYGGLYTMLSGDSESFSLKYEINDKMFKNKYEFLNRYYDYDYCNNILIFESVKILHQLDENMFDKLALNDKSKLILLNMISYRLNIRPSDELIHKLLKSDNDLNQNIGLSFITDVLTSSIKDISDIEYSKSNGLPITKDIKEIENTIKTEVEKCCDFLKSCNKEKISSLMFNYILVHQSRYPIIFAYKLMSSEFRSEFIKQINSSGKIKVLKDMCFVINLISNTPALNNKKRRISKEDLYFAITQLLITFIEEDRIYSLENYYLEYIQYICEHLPSKCIKKLCTYLKWKRNSLMYEKIDRLVRFKIYIKDKKMADIIDAILNECSKLIN